MTTYETIDSTFVAPILDFLPDAIIWVRPILEKDGEVEDFQVGYSNKAADEGVNHPKGSLTGLRILQDGVPSLKSAPDNFKHFLDVYKTGQVKEYTFFAHHSGREYETVRRMYEGGVLSTTRDRRAQREAERKEQEKSLLLNSIVNNSPVGIQVYEAIRNEEGAITDFKIKLFNEVLNQLTGISDEERERYTFKELLHVIGSDGIYERYKNTAETGEGFSFEFLSPRVNRWLTLSVAKLGDGFLVMLSDITQLKDLQLHVQQSAERFKTVINTSQAGLFTLLPVMDNAGEIIDFRFGIVNPSVGSFIGIEAETLAGSLGSVYFPAYKTNGLFDVYKDTYLNGTPYNFDFHYEDGFDNYFNINIVKMGEEVLVTFTDQTALKRLQRELEIKIRELEISNANLEEFAYAASHDLQEPLRKIHFFSERLKTELLPTLSDEKKRMFDRMESATNRMRTLISDLLTYSQISLKAEEFKEVDLDQLLHGVIQDFEATISETKAAVNIDSLCVIKGDERQLRRLFYNLISNALKYRKPNVAPEINIRCKSIEATDPLLAHLKIKDTRTYLMVEVIDNGIGFKQEDADKIFKVFQRLHGRTEYEGTGVGLAIVQKVVSNHQGHITAQGSPNEGATFRIFLPE